MQYNTDYSIDYDKMNVEVKEFAIGGKLVALKCMVSESKLANFKSETEFKTFIKMQMANQLAEFLIDNKLVEFTQKYSAVNDSRLICVRCYLAPDSQVKILRTLNT